MGQKQFPLKEVSIEELFFSPEKNIYEIPIYQRNYAWEKDEIAALIGDVCDEYKKGAERPYYIGTLVSYPKGDNTYEIIDGQQRLTTIRIILSALNISPTNRLTYRARKKSDETIKNLPVFIKDENHEVDDGIEHGYKYAETALNDLGIAHDDKFINYFLEQVHIIHYKVPKDIDLNHYFEIMNSRGEQLEKHEIEKANLMQKLDNDDERKVFNIIWECCSNMSVYAQQSIDGIKAEDIFGSDLHSFSIRSFEDLMRLYLNERGGKKEDIRTISISEIIDPDKGNRWADIKDEIEKKDSFQPIIDFPNFLLIVLKISRMHESSFVPKNFNLDDKELLNEFKNANMNAEQVRSFAFTLLKSKFLLDNFVVHHSKEDDTIDSNPWKLQVWHKDGKNYYLKNLDDGQSQEVLAQLLSMFEVSFTARQRKNYLFYCMLYLMNNDITNIFGYQKFVEGLAEKYFKRVYLDASKLNDINTPIPGSFDESIIKDNRFDESDNPVRSVKDFINIYGDGTVRSKGVPLYIFNYLDYLLWRTYNVELQGEKKKETDPARQAFFAKFGCSDFGLKIFDQFYFSRTRRSLEHYYPQNQAWGKDGRPTQDQINCFGNFAMIGSEANSSGSDWSPKTKLDHYLDSSVKINRISVASLKFWTMMQVCKDKQKWEFEDIIEHQNKMLSIMFDNSLTVGNGYILNNRTSLDVASIMLDWAKEKSRTGEILIDLERCGKKFVRYTTSKVSSVFPDAKEVKSGWGTKNYYFFEIVNEQEKEIRIQFDVNSTSIPDYLRRICDKINIKFPSRFQKENWMWRTPFVSQRFRLNSLTTKQNIIDDLDTCYKQAKLFEVELVEYLMGH